MLTNGLEFSWKHIQKGPDTFAEMEKCARANKAEVKLQRGASLCRAGRDCSSAFPALIHLTFRGRDKFTEALAATYIAWTAAAGAHLPSAWRPGRPRPAVHCAMPQLSLSLATCQNRTRQLIFASKRHLEISAAQPGIIVASSRFSLTTPFPFRSKTAPLLPYLAWTIRVINQKVCEQVYNLISL